MGAHTPFQFPYDSAAEPRSGVTLIAVILT
jgi:hypothetical protein